MRASIRVPVHGLGNLCKTFHAKKVRGIRRSGGPQGATVLIEAFLSFLLDVHFDLRSYIAEHLDGHGKFPDGLEGLAKLCLTFVNLEALRRESFRDIRRGN